MCTNTLLAFYNTGRKSQHSRWPGSRLPLTLHPSTATHVHSAPYTMAFPLLLQPTNPIPASGSWNWLIPLTLVPQASTWLTPWKVCHILRVALPVHPISWAPIFSPYPQLFCINWPVLIFLRHLGIFEILLFICLLTYNCLFPTKNVSSRRRETLYVLFSAISQCPEKCSW